MAEHRRISKSSPKAGKCIKAGKSNRTKKDGRCAAAARRREVHCAAHERLIPYTIHVPERIVERLRALNLGRSSRKNVDAGLLVRFVDWASVQSKEVYEAIIWRDSVYPRLARNPGESVADYLERTDLGPGQGCFLRLPEARLRFGGELFTVAPAGQAPPLPPPAVKFSREERAYLEELDRELDASCGGDEVNRSAPDGANG